MSITVDNSLTCINSPERAHPSRKLDEVHRFNKSQQDALLPGVETGIVTLVGATTENPFFEVNAPLLSRSTVFRLEPLDRQDLVEVAERALRHEGASMTGDALEHLTNLADGDARATLTTLEVSLALSEADGRNEVRLEDVERARQSRVLRYGEDDHYDVISAFIKSIRGSDPTPPSTGWPACCKPARTPASSPAAW